MIHTDEDDEFARIEHENEMRKGQPYHFVDKWKALTDMELLMAYGWKDFEANTLLQQNYKDKILEGLRNVEAAIKEKNNV
jgi:hypothetical protein